MRKKRPPRAPYQLPRRQDEQLESRRRAIRRSGSVGRGSKFLDRRMRLGSGGVMASAAVLDLAKLVAAIPGPKPTGVDLREESSANSTYYAIKDARNAARAAERQLVGEGEE